MVKEFKHLDEKEQEMLYDAVPLITILIAGADGEINKSEITWANRITKIRSYSMSDNLHNYYKKVGEHFEERLQYFIDRMPLDTDRRKDAISEELAKLNDILPKIEYNYRLALYRSFLSFSKHVAQSSGGIIRALSISHKEAVLIDLPMLKPIN